MPHSEKPHDRTHVPRSGSPAAGCRRGDASAPHRSARRSLAMRAAAATDLLVFDLRVVPTARSSHTTVPGRAQMRPPRVSCQEVDPFAGGRSCCTWRGSCSKPLFRLSSWLERGCTLENFLSLTNQVEHCRWGGHSKLFFSEDRMHNMDIIIRPRSTRV